MSALLSTVSCLQNDFAPHTVDEEATLTGSEELTNDKSHPVGTIWSKSKGMIQISIFNPYGLQPEQLSLQLQMCVEDEIDIQCYNKINCDVTKSRYQQKYTDVVNQYDHKAQPVWGNNYLPMDSDWKPGGTGIVLFGSVSGRIKKNGVNSLGRWIYQLF